MLRLSLALLHYVSAQMVELNTRDDKSCWVEIYRQADFMNFNDLSSYEDDGYGFWMEWDDIYYITWKQEQNPLSVSFDSTDNLLTGNYHYYGVSSNIFGLNSSLDFGGLGLSADSGILLDGRSSDGGWFAVGATLAMEHTETIYTGVPAWRNSDDRAYFANTATLYVWDAPSCGSWVLASYSPTNPPTRPPSSAPSPIPTFEPANHPTKPPTTSPTQEPTVSPTTMPSQNPSSTPTTHPTAAPTGHPTPGPSPHPTTPPTGQPTFEPSPHPTLVYDFINVDRKSNWLLYMLVGFSVGGFLVITVLLILCWRRLDGTRREEVVKQQLAALERIKTLPISTLGELTPSQRALNDYPETYNEYMGPIRRSLRSTYTYPVTTEFSVQHLKIEGRSRSQSTPMYQPVEIKRKPSLSRSKTYSQTSQWTTGPQETTGGEPYSLKQMPARELSYQSKTVDEEPVVRRRMKPRRSSLSSRQIKGAWKKLQQEERKREMENESYFSGSESEESAASKVNSVKFSIDDLISKQVQSLWSKKNTLADLDDASLDDGEVLSSRVRSASTDENKISNDSVLRSENHVIAKHVDDLKKWRRQLSGNALSVMSNNSADEQSVRLGKIHRSTPSITHSETENRMSTKDQSIYIVPEDM